MRKFILTVSALTLSAFAADAAPSPSEGYGPHPQLPEAHERMIPTVNPARAVGWPKGVKPVAAKGLRVNAFATGLNHPRWLYVLPNGDVLVANTNTPKNPVNGFRDWISRKVMDYAGAGVDSLNSIILLRDKNHDGVAETRTVFLSGLNSPFGMVLVDHNLYVADTDAVLRFPYADGKTSITARPEKIVDLPAGHINYHWTKNIVASRDGKKLYVSVGSNSNAGENGPDNDKGRAAIWEVDPQTRQHRIFASGLRNPVGMDWQPQTGALWVAVNERDELGDNLVPDYMTSVRDGGFYGWPYSYFGQHIDTRVKQDRPDLVKRALAPDYALGAHTASLGLAFYNGTLLPAHYRGGAFIGQHGSWNRSVYSGYKVVFVPFANGKPSGMPEDVLTGFLDADGRAQGRPVGVTVAKDGALLVADDVGNAVWRVTPQK